MQNVLRNLNEYKRPMLVGVALGVLLAGAFVAGFFLRDAVGVAPRPVFAQVADSTGYELLDEVQGLLDAYYLRPQPDPKEREYAAIRGMLSALGDRYTFFIDPPVARSESDVLAGTYGGIGVLVQRNEAGEIVLFPFPEGPAARAGIEDGDVVLQINALDLDQATPQDQIDQMLRGEVKEGSGVELTVRRALSDETLTVFIPFEVINVPSVTWRVLAEDDNLGYVQILRFTSRTPTELQTALTELREAGIDGLLLDLRNNNGGLLQESINVADEFINDGVIVSEASADGEQSFYATEGGLATDWPIAALVNQGTASGAELVAGALQDDERAIVIGQQTYGKGTIQQIFPLSDGSSLHVTSAEWYTPDGHALSDVGLEPDILMIPDANGRDVELGEAIRQLQQVLATQES